jgi:hypothetical protein
MKFKLNHILSIRGELIVEASNERQAIDIFRSMSDQELLGVSDDVASCIADYKTEEVEE